MGDQSASLGKAVEHVGAPLRLEVRCRELSRYLTERDFFIDNLLVRIDFIVEMIWWPGFAPWEFDFPFPGSLISACLDHLT